MFTFEVYYLDWLSQFYSEWRETSNLVNFQDFCLGAILVEIWKWLNLLNSVQYIKKTLANHLYIWIWSFSLTITALQWMKRNFKIGQFEDFCKFIRFWSKFQKWLKLLYSVPFIKETLLNHVYIRIWSFWLTFTVLQWIKTNLQN